MASAALDHHVPVLLEDDIGRLVKVQDGDARELCGRAAGLGHILRLHEVHQRLDDGVVGGIHVGVEGEGALAVAVERLVAVRRDDPVLPVQVAEAHPQHPFLATWQKRDRLEYEQIWVLLGGENECRSM